MIRETLTRGNFYYAMHTTNATKRMHRRAILFIITILLHAYTEKRHKNTLNVQEVQEEEEAAAVHDAVEFCYCLYVLLYCYCCC